MMTVVLSFRFPRVDRWKSRTVERWELGIGRGGEGGEGGEGVEGVENFKLLTPYSLLPTPYSLLLTPYSLLPTPYS